MENLNAARRFCCVRNWNKNHVRIKETPFGYTIMHKNHVQIKERRLL